MSETFEEQLRLAVAGWRTGPKRGCVLIESLDPARDHVVGDPSAPVAIVEYIGYGSTIGCEVDRALRASLRELLTAGRVCFALRHFPLIDVSAWALLAAVAVEAAGLQHRFWELHETISIRMGDTGARTWRTASSAETAIFALARDLDIDVKHLQEDMKRPAISERILHDFTTGSRSGVNGTPTFYVAGIRQIIDRPEELGRRVGRALEGDMAALWPPVKSSARDARLAKAR